MYQSKIENRKPKTEKMADKVEETLVDALKQALAEHGEQRLFRSGKLAGLFSGRTGAAGDAAALALREGLLEIVRTDAKGKTSVEWVKVTPRGVSFLHEKESPVQVLRELLEMLRVNQEGVPGWLAGIQQSLKTLDARLVEETQRWTARLEALSRRVEEALRRAHVALPAMSDGMAAIVPWGVDALTYLAQRQQCGASGAAASCPLPELFKAVNRQHAALTVEDFHTGLRRLHDRGSLKLLPSGQAVNELQEPEYALIEGASVYYYATR
jgi:hypothetical protein